LTYFHTNLFQISANGLISFDRAFSEIVPQPRELRSVAIFPFHLANNLTNGGTVSVRQVTGLLLHTLNVYHLFVEADASNYGLLTKASLIVQNKFNLKRFQATSVLIVTYDKVQPESLKVKITFLTFNKNNL
jgi:hypothetical protein